MKLPPGPVKWRELISLLIQRSRHPIKLYQNIFNRYGNIVFIKIGPLKFLMLNDADAIEQVLHGDAKNYTKSTAYERFKLIVGNGLLVSEGEVWKKQRRLLSWAFSSKHIEKLHPLMMQESINLVKRWKNISKVDVAEEMNVVTLQIISMSLFGRNQLVDSKIIRSSLQTILSYLQTSRHLLIQILLAPFPIKNKKARALEIESLLPFQSSQNFFHAIKQIDKVVHSMIQERRQIGQQENFLDTLISATDGDIQGQMTNGQLRDEVFNMLIAGHETTSNALTWTWHLLVNHPEIYQKMRSEISQYVKGEAPTYEELKNLNYTLAVFEESMRLYPPFWRVSRRNMHETQILGYDIPKGTNILNSIYTIQRSSKYWEDPETFKPERFLGDNKRHRFSYIPFGAGPRSCIAAQFATIEALTILAVCSKNFIFEKTFEGEPEYFMSLTLQPKNGLKVQLKEAKNS